MNIDEYATWLAGAFAEQLEEQPQLPVLYLPDVPLKYATVEDEPSFIHMPELPTTVTIPCPECATAMHGTFPGPMPYQLHCKGCGKSWTLDKEKQKS